MASVESLLKNFVVNKSGKDVDWNSFTGAGKFIGLYFSAHWCPPCRGFTPKLVDWYKKMKESSQGQGLEVIFVSSDHDQAAFDEYYATMPWLALNYINRSEKDQLTKKFKVSGIPTFVIIDGESGAVTCAKGRQKVSSDPDGFPWIPETFDQILYSGNLIKNDNTEVPSTDLKGKVKAIYFSAHWCPPCRGFTPDLIDTYKKLKEQGKNFEIVFASSDRDESSFKEYFGSMPWLALPLGDSRKEKLSDFCDVEGIPKLVIFDEDDNKITSEGRAAVGGDREGKDFPWLPKPLNELTEATASVINSNPSLVYFTDASDAGIQSAKDHLKTSADKYFNKNQEDQKVMFFYTGEDDLVDSLRNFAKIPNREPMLVVINIPEQEVYECSEENITADVVNKFVDDFIAGKLKPRPLR